MDSRKLVTDGADSGTASFRVALIYFVALFVGGIASLPSDVKADAVPAAVLERIAELGPELGEAVVRPAPVEGLFEVSVGARVVYLSADGRYLIQGEILDIPAQTNLTENTKRLARQTAIAAFGDEKLVVFEPTGKARHTITVFTDVDCPYCSRFHREVPELLAAGVRVRYVAFPRKGIPSKNYDRMVSVWCADDPQEAMTDAKEGRDIAAATCPNDVRAQFRTGRDMGVRGTPTLLLADGQLVPGYVPWKRLLRMLSNEQ